MNVTQWQRLLKLAILLVSLHSFLLGITILLFPRAFTSFFGFDSGDGFFWKSQSGIFLTILAIAYCLALKELEKSRTLVNFLVMSKALAVAFLLTHYLCFNAPASMALAAAGDGFMGACVYVLNVKSPLISRA